MDKEKFLSALKNLKDAVFSSDHKFKDQKLQDGTIIRYGGDALVVGMPVMAVTDQGELPLPDGDYIIDDSTTFTISGGVATVVTPAVEDGQTSTPPPPPANMADASKAGAAAAKAVVESIIKETRFAEITKELGEEIAAFKTAKEAFASHKEGNEKKIEELELKYDSMTLNFQKALELIEQIADLPSQEQTDLTKSKKKKTAQELSLEFRASLK